MDTKQSEIPIARNRIVSLKTSLMWTTKLLESISKDCQCKELQNVAMDLESADQHIQVLLENGPSAPYVEPVPYVDPELAVNHKVREHFNDVANGRD